MKKYLIITILICFCSCKKTECNFNKRPITLTEIDSLDTPEEIEEYIHDIDSLNFGTPGWNYRLKKLQDLAYESDITNYGRKLADSLEIKNSYFKNDFDHNGCTDLVVTGYFDRNEISYSYCLMNFGHDSIKIKDINAFSYAFTIPRIVEEDNQPFLEIFYPDMPDPYRTRKIVTIKKKLAYRYGTFVEYNEKPIDLNIKKIEFTARGCMGNCPAFDMILNNDRTVIFKPHFFNFSDDANKEEKQIIKSNLELSKYNEIISLLNYINFPGLDNYYPENATDGQSIILKITYGNGKVKTIDDNLYPGTYGLRGFYEMIFNLRNDLDWK